LSGFCSRSRYVALSRYERVNAVVDGLVGLAEGT
jgi:hypothetical protein